MLPKICKYLLRLNRTAEPCVTSRRRVSHKLRRRRKSFLGSRGLHSHGSTLSGVLGFIPRGTMRGRPCRRLRNQEELPQGWPGGPGTRVHESWRSHRSAYKMCTRLSGEWISKIGVYTKGKEKRLTARGP